MNQDLSAQRGPRPGTTPWRSHWGCRRTHRGLQRTLLVGQPSDVVALHQHLLRRSRHPYRVIGCCLTADRPGEPFAGPAVLGGLDDVPAAVRRHQVDTVGVLSVPELDGATVRRLTRALAATRAELLLAPAVTPIAGRERVRPQERCGLSGGRAMVKTSFDRLAAALVLVLLAPVLIGVAVCVGATSPGPVLVRHQRVGRGGRVFSLLTFRCTSTGADPLTGRGETALGSVLRRHAIDVLPQLLNVLKGDMSLVGPPPRRPSGFERSGSDGHGRCTARPGLIGPGQASGGPTLAEDACVQTDADYHENWSLTGDLLILRHAFGAVLRRDGTP